MIPSASDPSTWTDSMLRDACAGLVAGYETMSREEILAALPAAIDAFWERQFADVMVIMQGSSECEIDRPVGIVCNRPTRTR